MADSRVLIEIVSTAKGLKVVAKDTEKLAKNVERTDKAYKDTEKSGNKYHKQEKAIHQSNLSTAKGFSKMKETMGSGSSGLVGAYATLAANVFAATAAFNALRQAAQVETLVEGFTFLADTAGRSSQIISNNIREITNNALSMEQAMRSSAIAITSGFSTTQFERLVEVGKNASIALGRNLADSVDRLTRGVAKLEPEILDELGILVRLDTATREYAAALGKTASDLTDFERRQAFLNATIEQGEEKYSALSGTIDVNAFDKLAGTFANLTHNLLQFINTGLKPFVSFFANSQLAMFGAITFLAKGIISTMFPVLTELGDRFARSAQKAHIAADKMKDDTQRAFEAAQSGIAERGTKKGDPAGFQSLVAGAKKGTLQTKDLNKAMKSLTISESLRKKNLDKFKGDDLKNKKAELKRIQDLKKEVQELINLEKQRAGAGKGQILAQGKARRQDIIAEGAGAIGGMGAFGGIKQAFSSMGELREEIKTTNNTMNDSFNSGKMTKLGRSISGGFKLASGGVRLFGAALINAIPFIGQMIFVFGILRTAFNKFFGQSEGLVNALKQVETTVETQIDKYKTLGTVVDNLTAKQKDLEIESLASGNAIVQSQNTFKIARLETLKYSNEVKVTAGIITELADSFEKLNDEILRTSISDRELRKQQRDVDFEETYGVEATFWNKLITYYVEGQLAQSGLSLEIDKTSKKVVDQEKVVKSAENAYEFFKSKIQQTVNQMERENLPAFAKLNQALGPEGLDGVFEKADKSGASFAVKMAIINKEFRDASTAANAQVAAIEALDPAFTELTKKITAFADKNKKSNAFITLAGDMETFENKVKDLAQQEILASLQEGGTVEQGLESAGKLLATVLPQEALTTFKNLGLTLDDIVKSLGDYAVAQDGTIESGESRVGVVAEEYNQHGLLVETIKDILEADKKRLEIAKTKAKMAEQEFVMNEKLANLQRFGTFELSAAAEVRAANNTFEVRKQLNQDETTARLKEAALIHHKEMENIKKENIADQAKVATLQKVESDLFAIKVEDIKKEGEFTLKTLTAARLQAIKDAGKTGTVSERGAAVMEAGFADAGIAEQIQKANNVVSPFIESMKEFGTEGELMSSVAQGAFTIAGSIAAIGDAGFKSAEGMQAVGNMIGAVGGIMAANSKNQIAEIDKQIEMEKKRDGKSKESLAKIKQMEKQKEQIERKAFEMRKKMLIAQTIASTAAGVMSTMEKGGFFVSPLAMIVAAMGAAQVALISRQTFQGGGGSTEAAKPQSISIGKRDNRVDVSRTQNAGELAYLRGEKGVGTNANNFTPSGAAGIRSYGAGMKSYASGILVGEQGPEVVSPAGPVNVTPNDKLGGGTSNVNFTINAVDAAGVQQVLEEQRGNIIGMIREAAHAHGEEFIEAVDTSAYGEASGGIGGSGGYG